jgi:hypothetical protein
MQARPHSALRGWVWLVAGLRLWRQSPLALTGAATFLSLGMLLLLTVPALGQIAFPLLQPALGVGMFLICMAVRAGKPAPPALLFGAFGPRLPVLLGLGGLRLAWGLLAAALAMLFSGLDLGQSASLATQTEGEAIALPANLQSFLLWVFVLGLPMEIASWFAAPLIALRQQPLMKALFFSLVACLRNFGALLVYLVSVSICLIALPMLVAAQIGALFPALGSLLLGPVLMVALPVFFAGFYCSAEDIFGNWE